MSGFLDLFRKQTPFERALMSSTILNSSETVDLNDIKNMLQGFPKPNEDDQLVQSMTIVQIFKEFIRLIPQSPPPHVRLKVIITCNVLLGDMKYGRLFAPQFALWTGWKAEIQHVKGKSNSKDILNKFIHSYQGILQKVSINQDLLMKSKIQSGSGILFKNLQQSLTLLYKIVNLLNYIFSFKDIFEIAALTQTQLAVMEAYLLVWNDAIAFFLYFERFILQFLDCYSQLECKDSIQVYELFRDFLLCTEKIKEFFAINTKFPRPTNLKEPRWSLISKKQIDEVNLFFQNVRLFATGRSKKEKNQSLSNQRMVQTSDRENRKHNSNTFMKKQTDGSMLQLKHANNLSQLVQYTFETDQGGRQQSQFG